MSYSGKVLPIIVIAQFFCTSLWFAGNAVMEDLRQQLNLDASALGHLTSAVQVGFIAGTLLFALLSVADRFSPSKVFFFCALAGALLNLGMIFEGNSLQSLLSLRILTGFFLAGIYPVGMKIASDYYRENLGKSLGYLVGALVLGTAFPHLLKFATGAGDLSWKLVLQVVSSMAAAGGLLILLLVPDGPYRKLLLKRDTAAFFKIFKQKRFKAAAFGYFGHMWELYAFWAFVPVMLQVFELLHPDIKIKVGLLSFIIIAAGGPACVAGGYMSRRYGSKKIAAIALFLSGCCCLFFPLIVLNNSVVVFGLFMTFWGAVVVADSPLFSTLVAINSPEENKGTALTIVNCIGFAITIVSIQLFSLLMESTDSVAVFSLLATGPALGLLGLLRHSWKK
ncbi:MFS transporter [Salinimicrobium sp. GXAS 041]|uniref:MFS transporter n=1 Tax=Salinimicrobium sp. GXAS 041 TaxID=3400806 RepID=UPI003C758CD6